MSTFERRPSLTSYDIEKAVEADRDNKFSRGRGRQRATEASVVSTEEGVLRSSMTMLSLLLLSPLLLQVGQTVQHWW